MALKSEPPITKYEKRKSNINFAITDSMAKKKRDYDTMAERKTKIDPGLMLLTKANRKRYNAVQGNQLALSKESSKKSRSPGK